MINNPKYNRVTDRLIETRKRLCGKLDNATWYLKYGPGGKIAELKVDHLEADTTVLRLVRLELAVLGVRWTRADIYDARSYWANLSDAELQSCYGHNKNRGDHSARADFETWLVEEVQESRCCIAHDC